MIKIFFFILFCFTISCKNNNNYNKGENIFFTELLKKYPQINNGKFLLFILNKSDCQPCEKEVINLCLKHRNKTAKLFIVSNKQNMYNFEKTNYILFDREKLTKFGLRRANGTVLVFNNGECLGIESIDIPNIQKLDRKINHLLN